MPTSSRTWDFRSGGLLIHPDLFAQTDFHLFCLRYDFLSRSERPSFAVHGSARVQQEFAGHLTVMVQPRGGGVPGSAAGIGVSGAGFRVSCAEALAPLRMQSATMMGKYSPVGTRLFYSTDGFR
jgi:hypothetical protein